MWHNKIFHKLFFICKCMCQKYLLPPKGSEIPLSHYYMGGNMLKKNGIQHGSTLLRDRWKTFNVHVDQFHLKLSTKEPSLGNVGKFSTVPGRPPQSSFWTLLVLLQTGAAYISCFKCFQMLAFVPWGENGHVSTNTSIGATILFPCHPYVGYATTSP